MWTRSDSVSTETEFALDIRYARNIPARRLVNASVKEMRRLGFGDRDRLREWSTKMARVFPEIQKGDRLTGVNLPGVGAQFYHNGRLVGTVADDQFALAFFSIWLDPRTREPGLRESLIGQS
ncbi:MAG: chalcone isomerase family protein [Betaproteobacteria bacterium]|nr:MAG: chalcone isomerase family protein [Betaproteobacteria bacterium]